MSIISWLTQLDPNVVSTLVTVLISTGAFLYHKVRGDRTDSWGSVIDDIVTNLINETVGTIVTEDQIAGFINKQRDRIEAMIWGVLTKRGIPRNALSESLVHAAIEKGTAELGTRIRNEIATRKLPDNMKSLADAAQKVLDAFKPPPIVKDDAT